MTIRFIWMQTKEAYWLASAKIKSIVIIICSSQKLSEDVNEQFFFFFLKIEVPPI